MYDFIVAGLYYSNDFSELNCFVNINYLKDTLHIGSNEHNIVFSMKEITFLIRIYLQKQIL